MGERGQQLQEQVLDIMRQRCDPASAYELLDALREGNPRIAPTTVYRALSALITRGRIHRLESLNAYVICQHDGAHDGSILSICGDCGTVEESVAPELLASLCAVTGKSGFEAERHVIEVHGTCAACGSEEELT